MYFLECLTVGKCLMFSSWLDCVYVLLEKDHKSNVPFLSPRVKVTYHQQDVAVVNLFHLAEVMFVSFLHCDMPFPFPSFYALWEEVIICRLHLRYREICSTFFSMVHLRKMFGILLQGRFILYICNNLFVSVQRNYMCGGGWLYKSVWTFIFYFRL